MRLKLIALVVALTGITTWALLHQSSRKEIIPDAVTLYAFYKPGMQELLVTSLEACEREYKIILHEQTVPMNIEQKIDAMLHGIQENWGGVFVLKDSETDAPPPKKEIVLKSLEHADIVVQKIGQAIGAGYIACKANKRTLQLWETIKHLIDEHPTAPDHDYLNALLLENKVAKLRWDYLPSTQTDAHPVA